jgi:hypothetical protein
VGYIKGRDRHQIIMLPELLDDYISENNPVKYIDAFVENLDLGKEGFTRATPLKGGRPGYDPRCLLKLYIYGDYFYIITTVPGLPNFLDSLASRACHDISRAGRRATTGSPYRLTMGFWIPSRIVGTVFNRPRYNAQTFRIYRRSQGGRPQVAPTGLLLYSGRAYA